MAAATAVAALACGGSSTGPDYHPDIPAQWVPAVTNPLFRLIPGTRWDYRAQTSSGVETSHVEVLPDTRVISGVTATVVHDQVSVDGVVVEETFDWYAQDTAGNVWYLG